MFDSHLNTKFLNECLDSLLFEYDHHPIDAFKHRPMFESAFLLLNQNKPNVYDRLRFISPSLRNQDRFLIASRLLIRARAIRNYSFILNRFDKLPFAMAICLNTQISTIQFEYLRCLSYSSASRNATIPLRKVADLICPFEGDSAAALSYVTELAKSAGISCTPDHLKAEKSGAFKPPPIVRKCAIVLH